jgi:hypothetical protein
MLTHFPPIFAEFHETWFAFPWREWWLKTSTWLSLNGRAVKSHYHKGDENVKSFLLTLKNPHSVPPQKFAPETEEERRTINCFPYAKELSAPGWFCQIWSAWDPFILVLKFIEQTRSYSERGIQSFEISTFAAHFPIQKYWKVDLTDENQFTLLNTFEGKNDQLTCRSQSIENEMWETDQIDPQ